jgi:segregation and condensation protein A
MPLQDDYQVSLDAFQGPLDLLLFLIRRAEVDIHDIPIARLTDQYLAFLRQIDHIDIDLAGEFLVMAATLIEIKSRTLMPAEARPGSDDDAAEPNDGDAFPSDPRHELVQQLLEYQRYRIAADDLDHRREEFAQRFAVHSGRAEGVDPAAEPRDLELEDAHVLDLFEAYERIMASVDLTRVGDHRVEMDDTPIQLHQDDLLDRLRRAASGRIDLHEAFEGRSRLERIGLFLAMLELVRQRQVVVKQESALAGIVIELNADPPGEDRPVAAEVLASEMAGAATADAAAGEWTRFASRNAEVDEDENDPD